MLKVDTFTFSGRVGKAPEFKEVGGGLAKMSVAINRSWKDKQGEWVDNTQWVELEAWGKQAEWLMSKGINKGDIVYCAGAPETNAWLAQGNEAKASLIVKLGFNGFVQVVTKKEGDGGFKADPKPAAATVPAEDDGLPF